MIRSVLALFIFSVALCAFIVSRPTITQVPEPLMVRPDVTRNQDPSPLPAIAPAVETQTAATPVAVAPSPVIEPTVEASVINAVVEQIVTPAPAPLPKRQPAELVQVSAPAPSVEPVPQPQAVAARAPEIPLSDAGISDTANNVLTSLGLLPGAETAPSTSEVLQEIKTALASGTVPAGQDPDADTLDRIVAAALQEGRSDAEIDEIVNAAALAGNIRVPQMLVTSDGRVDTHVLLKSIVIQATIAAGGAAPEVPAVPTGDGAGVEVRVVQRATQTEQYRFYTVRTGDSLGAIALKFYGNATHYPVIFDANRTKLSSPDLIRVGQRLVVPDLDAA